VKVKKKAWTIMPITANIIIQLTKPKLFQICHQTNFAWYRFNLIGSWKKRRKKMLIVENSASISPLPLVQPLPRIHITHSTKALSSLPASQSRLEWM
jgi:hypothetical protein